MGKKVTQAASNPYPNSDTNKRYYTYDYFLKNTFGGKVAKLPIDAGFTCPNIDGRCGHGGCIYCSDKGSGDFAPPPEVPIREQMDASKALTQGKWKTDKVLPYFQAHTNTYAPLEVLKEKYEQALDYPGVVGMNIATRADCLEPEVSTPRTLNRGKYGECLHFQLHYIINMCTKLSKGWALILPRFPNSSNRDLHPKSLYLT